MKNQDIRWIQRFQNFKKAFQQLSDAAALVKQRPLSELEQQGLIKGFELTHELAWNVLKDYLEAQGFTGLIGSRGATREAFKNGLIAEGEAWMEMIESRNKSTHTYDCKTAEAIARAITTSYVPEFDKFQKKFVDLEREETK
jgi:nucleotidyltransferase substrate binding protein (TIGR01987 family)